MNRWKPLAIITLFACMISAPSLATHMRGGEIKVTKIGQGTLSYQITLTAYIDSESPVPFGGASTDLLYIRGTSGAPQTIPVPEIRANSVCPFCTYTVLDEARHIAMVQFTTTILFRGNDTYTISYSEVNRNADIINMANSVETPFYIETSFKIDPLVEHLENPNILAKPIFIVPPGNMSLSLAASDLGDNKLYYKLVTPKYAVNRNVLGYELPENMHLNRYTGELTWDGKWKGMPASGEFTFAVCVYQYQNGKRIGYIVRDFQIIVDDNIPFTGAIKSKLPLGTNNSIHVEEGEEKSIRVLASAEHPIEMTLESFTELKNKEAAEFSFTTYDSIDGIKVGLIQFKVDPSIVRVNPYSIVVRSKFENENGQVAEQDISMLVYTTEEELPDPEGLQDFPVSIDEDIRATLSAEVFPNPVKEFLQVKVSSGTLSSAKLYTSTGKLITTLSALGKKIDFRSVESGFYLIRVEFSDKRSKTFKVWKE